jgi:polyisoprenoid-binding protein YceI
METATKTIWSIDPTHSEVQFKVKHLVISTVTGQFTQFNASIEATNDDFCDASVSFEAQIDSISTNNADRDRHLKSADFFDAANYPSLKFESTKWTKIDDENVAIEGNLTLKDATHPVTLKGEFGGVVTDPYGNVKAGFELTGKINRKDFGLTFNVITEAGHLVLSEEIKLIANVQFAKQA